MVPQNWRRESLSNLKHLCAFLACHFVEPLIVPCIRFEMACNGLRRLCGFKKWLSVGNNLTE
jgi:hypothetical protein